MKTAANVERRIGLAKKGVSAREQRVSSGKWMRVGADGQDGEMLAGRMGPHAADDLPPIDFGQIEIGDEGQDRAGMELKDGEGLQSAHVMLDVASESFQQRDFKRRYRFRTILHH